MVLNLARKYFNDLCVPLEPRHLDLVVHEVALERPLAHLPCPSAMSMEPIRQPSYQISAGGWDFALPALFLVDASWTTSPPTPLTTPRRQLALPLADAQISVVRAGHLGI
ncbi:MAG: hypothetical protein ABJN51_05740 [Sneathiella sp.]